MKPLTFRAMPVLLLLLLSLMLAGCQDSGVAEMLFEMAFDWAMEKQLVTIDAEDNLSPDYIQIAKYEGTRAWNKVFGPGYTTGDEQLDAALDAAEVVKSVLDADQLAREGARTQDPDLIEQAIGKRPHDWHYHDQAGAVLAATDDVEGALVAFHESEMLVGARIEEGGSCLGLMQNMLRGRLQALAAQIAKEPTNEVLKAMQAQTQQQLTDVNSGAPGNLCAGR